MTTDVPGSRTRAALGSTRFGDVRWVSETGSTNADVMALARAGEAAGIVVVADHQTAGRGRRGRSWDAPPGASLMATVLLRPRSDDLGLTTMAVAVAAVEAIERCAGLALGIKWPNDLVWPGDGTGQDRKVAGLLAEVDWPAGSSIAAGWSEPSGAERLSLAVGIGINVAWGASMPEVLAETAVALDGITSPSPPPDREDLLVELLRSLDRWCAVIDANAPGRPGSLMEGDGPLAPGHDVRAAWRDRSATIGRRVRVDLGSDDVEGTAVDITGDGHLVVERDEGGRQIFAVGDVVHLRPLTGEPQA